MPLLLRTALLLVFSGAAASCATQSVTASGSPPPNPAEAATITADSEFNFLSSMAVVMKEVDGVAVQTSATRISVSPGHHEILVRCELISSRQHYMQTLKLDVAPRGTYRLGVKVGGAGGPCQAVAVKTN